MVLILACGCDIATDDRVAVVGDGFHTGHGGAGFVFCLSAERWRFCLWWAQRRDPLQAFDQELHLWCGGGQMQGDLAGVGGDLPANFKEPGPELLGFPTPGLLAGEGFSFGSRP